MTMKRAAVLGATGSTGQELVSQLSEKGFNVRILTRSEKSAADIFNPESFEIKITNMGDIESMTSAIDGADVVFSCIGTGTDINAMVKTCHVLSSITEKYALRTVHISSCWGFAPFQQTRLNELHPRVGGSTFVEQRRLSDDILKNAGVTVAHFPDFYGKKVRISPLQFALQCATEDRPFAWPSAANVSREHAYVPDAIAAVIALSEPDQCVGEGYIIPGSGELTLDDIGIVVEEVLGRPLRVTVPGDDNSPPDLDTTLVDELAPVLTEYSKPAAYDATKLRQVLTDFQTTSYKEGIKDTLAWLRN